MEVQHSSNPKNGMFYIEEDGNRIATMTYVNAGEDKFIIDHTMVDPEHEGQGLGRKLVAAAVKFARDNGLKIIPLCPYAKRVLEKSEEYKDVLVQ